MTKEWIAVVALSLTIAGLIFGAGSQIATLTERVDQAREDVRQLKAEIRALNDYLVLHANRDR